MESKHKELCNQIFKEGQNINIINMNDKKLSEKQTMLIDARTQVETLKADVGKLKDELELVKNERNEFKIKLDEQHNRSVLDDVLFNKQGLEKSSLMLALENLKTDLDSEY